MTLLAKYNLKSLLRRKAATVSTALSFALAVAVFVVLMGLAKGVLDVHHRAGNERNIVVLQKGASDAHFSSLSSEDLHKIRYREFVARTVNGRESVSPELELVSWVTLPQVAGKRHTNLRGVTAPAVDLHGIQLEQGRLFRGSSEAILGQTAAKRFGLRPGDKFTAEDQTYTVTGIFSCSGSVIESEVWCDLDGLMAVSGRMATTGKHSSMVIRVGDGYDLRTSLRRAVRRQEPVRRRQAGEGVLPSDGKHLRATRTTRIGHEPDRLHRRHVLGHEYDVQLRGTPHPRDRRVAGHRILKKCTSHHVCR